MPDSGGADEKTPPECHLRHPGAERARTDEHGGTGSPGPFEKPLLPGIPWDGLPSFWHAAIFRVVLRVGIARGRLLVQSTAVSA